MGVAVTERDIERQRAQERLGSAGIGYILADTRDACERRTAVIFVLAFGG